MSEHPTLFADAVRDANIAHGVARIRLVQVAGGGAIAPAGTLVVPLSQLPGFAAAMAGLVQQLQQRARAESGAADEEKVGGEKAGDAAPGGETAEPGSLN